MALNRAGPLRHNETFRKKFAIRSNRLGKILGQRASACDKLMARVFFRSVFFFKVVVDFRYLIKTRRGQTSYWRRRWWCLDDGRKEVHGG